MVVPQNKTVVGYCRRSYFVVLWCGIFYIGFTLCTVFRKAQTIIGYYKPEENLYDCSTMVMSNAEREVVTMLAW